MAIQIQLRSGTTAENNAFTGAVGELTYDTEKKQLRVHDGSTVGGKVVDNTTRDVTSQVSNATETTAGKAKIATTAIAQAGANDTDFITAKKLRDVSFASGQTYQDVKTIRLLNTTYTNSSAKAIAVLVAAAVAQNGSLTVTIGGEERCRSNLSYFSNTTCQLFFIVPANTSYQVNGSGTITHFQELKT